MSSLTDNTVMNLEKLATDLEELASDKEQVMTLFSKYNMEIARRTPFGMLGKAMEWFTKDDLLDLHYNLYFSYSLLKNSNKWL